MPGEWKLWRGGDCPIAPGERFQVRYDNGDLSAWDVGASWNRQSQLWNTPEPNQRIVAYRKALGGDHG